MEGSEQVGQAKQTKEERKAPYMVLTPMDVEIPVPGGGEAVRRLQVWREVATVDLPFRSQRRSAVLPALEQAKEDGKSGQAFLVLDEDAAAPMRLRERPLPPVDQRFEVISE